MEKAVAADQWGGGIGGFGYPGQPQWAPEPGRRRSGPLLVVAVVVIVLLVAAISVLGTMLWLGGANTSNQGAPATSTRLVTEEAEPDSEDSAATMPVVEPATPAPAPVVPSTPSGAYQCSSLGGGPFARAGAGSSATSCPFASSVRDSYLASGAGGGAATISAYSPVTGTSYTMNCAPAGTNVVQCTGGNNAVVYIY